MNMHRHLNDGNDGAHEMVTLSPPHSGSGDPGGRVRPRAGSRPDVAGTVILLLALISVWAAVALAADRPPSPQVPAGLEQRTIHKATAGQAGEGRDHDDDPDDHGDEDDNHAGHDHGSGSPDSGAHDDDGDDHSGSDGSSGESGDAHDDDGDAHDDDDGADDADDHAGHDPVSEGSVVELSPASMRFAGIATAQATTGTLSLPISIPGEVGFNEDRLAHVSPRFEGIVRTISAHVGSRVRQGDELALIESNSSLNTYAVVAPIDGTVVYKRITPGEFVSQDSDLFIVADLSTVWVHLDVPAKYTALIRNGHVVELETIGTAARTSGTVDYVAPVLLTSTRSGQARIVLPNADGNWRPGTFVIGHTRIVSRSPSTLVSREAIQVVAGEKVIFAPLGEGRYRAEPVQTGLSSPEQIEILSGLRPGAQYVCTGAFELKAQLTVGTLRGHAGHGH